MNKQVLKYHPKIIFYYVILSILSILQIFPFYLKLVESLEPPNFVPELGKIYLWPQKFSFENYIVAFKMSNLGKGFLNSLIYVSTYTGVSAIVAVLVGYVIAKKKFKGRMIVYIALISTMMVPGEVLMIPNYLLVRDVGLLNTLWALIIPGLVNTFGIFLSKQFLESLPDSYIEAAYMDGASELYIFLKIILPLASPVIGTYVILTYTAMWNEYLWPMIVLNNSALYPVQLAVKTFETHFSTPYDSILRSAALISALFPVIVVFLIFQRKFIEGIAIHGIK